MDEWHLAIATCKNEACPKFNVDVPNMWVPDVPEDWGWQGVQCGACQSQCEVRDQ